MKFILKPEEEIVSKSYINENKMYTLEFDKTSNYSEHNPYILFNKLYDKCHVDFNDKIVYIPCENCPEQKVPVYRYEVLTEKEYHERNFNNKLDELIK